MSATVRESSGVIPLHPAAGGFSVTPWAVSESLGVGCDDAPILQKAGSDMAGPLRQNYSVWRRQAQSVSGAHGDLSRQVKKLAGTQIGLAYLAMSPAVAIVALSGGWPVVGYVPSVALLPQVYGAEMLRQISPAQVIEVSAERWAVTDFQAEAARLSLPLGIASTDAVARERLQVIAADASDLFVTPAAAMEYLTTKPLDGKGRNGIEILRQKGLPGIIAGLDHLRFGSRD